MNGKRSSFTASSRWLIALPAVFLAFFPNTAHADPAPGLAYTVYDNWTGQGNGYNSAPPLPPTTPIVDSGISPAIDYEWGGGNILDSGLSEDVVVRWTGWIDPPTDQMYYLCASSDDGMKVYLDGVNVINDWYDRGGGCGETADVDFSDGEPKELLAWWYENGGGANAYLLWYTGSGWEVIPDSWYFQTNPTTTTSTTTTTVPETTTTVGETTTTEAETTTTSSTSTTSPAQAEEERRQEESRQEYQKQTECEKVNHAFDSCPLWPGRTTSLPPTTTAPPPPTTLPPPPDTTLPPPTQESTTPPPDATIPRPPVSTQVSRPDPTVPPTVPTATTVAEASPQPSTPAVETIPPMQPPTPVVPQPEQTSSAQVTDNPTPTEAAAVATNPEAVAELTEEEAEQVFAALDVEDLSTEQVTELVAAVQQAPTKVRQQFENKIDIFGEGLDDYVPVGSNIPVGERRTLVAVGGLIMAAGASIRVRR